MRWKSEAVIIAVKKMGEYDALLTIFTKDYGKHRGVVKRAYAKRLRSVVEMGNVVQVRCSSRNQRFGNYSLELKKSIPFTVLNHSGRLLAFVCACSIIEVSVFYNQPAESIFFLFKNLCTALQQGQWAESYCRWEIALLTELGMPLDLSRCAVTGSTEDLHFISPRSGRAVSGRAGFKYKDKLLRFPSFLKINKTSVRGGEIYNSLCMSRHFLQRSMSYHGGSTLPHVRHNLEGWCMARKDDII